jgi:hypothetical protein
MLGILDNRTKTRKMKWGILSGWKNLEKYIDHMEKNQLTFFWKILQMKISNQIFTE